MSETTNKTILLLIPLREYEKGDAIPVLRPNLTQDNCIALEDIIWFDETKNQLIINGRYKFDMSSLLQANLSITLTGDSGITDFTYNNHTYNKNDSIENEGSFNATITANVNEHYTFNKWQFEGVDIGVTNPLLHTFTESGGLRAITTPDKYTIAVSTNNASYGTVNGGGSYNYGLNCTITATANAGCEFIEWTKDGNRVSTSPTYSFNVMESANYTAVFRLQEVLYDYYVGWVTDAAAILGFSELGDNDLELLARGYSKSNLLVTEMVTSSMATGNDIIFFIMWTDTVKPFSGSIVIGLDTILLNEYDFRDTSVFNAPHELVMINNIRYTVAGMRKAFSRGETVTINFKEL